jgi:ribonuclease BN (tRNA processing enzyme)
MTPHLLDRRAFLASALAIAAARPRASAAQGAATKLILLGTGGGPRPRRASSGSAQVIVSRNVAYVIDCGDGVARQLAFAGVPLTTLRHIFITHQHSDHTADYGNLIWLAWAAGLSTRVDSWGPPPLDRMTKLFFEMNASDIQTRIANEGRVPLAPLVHVHEQTESGPVVSDDNVKVTSTLVDHPPVVPAFAYRFDAHDRSIVNFGRHRAIAEPGQARRWRRRAGALGDVSASHRPAGRPSAERRSPEREHPCTPDVG